MTISVINKTAVIGAGIMGHGIAQLFAMYGYPVKQSGKGFYDYES